MKSKKKLTENAEKVDVFVKKSKFNEIMKED